MPTSNPASESRIVTLAEVALDPKSGGSEAIYSYLPLPGQRLGDAVHVPLGNRRMVGFVIGFRDVDLATLGYTARSILAVIEGLSIPPCVIDLVHRVANEYLCSVPVALSAATPPAIKDRLVQGWKLRNAPTNDPNSVEAQVIETMKSEGGELKDQKDISPGLRKTLATMAANGWIEEFIRLKPFGAAKTELTYTLNLDQELIEQFLKKDGKKKPAQALTVMKMQEVGSSALSSGEIRAMGGVTETTVKALVTAKMLIPVDPLSAPPSQKPPQLNMEQELVVGSTQEAIIAQQSRPFLLFGVTGSGKTEVFLRTAATALAQGQKVLYLVPEIALATQAIAQIRERFGGKVAILHSELTPVERLQNWQRIRNNEVSIVLGPRSAVFAPIENLGLVIMDEEHEGGYKQEQSPRYHARTLARWLGEIHRCPVVFGSATPSVESFAEAEQNESEGSPARLTLLTLPKRAASAVMPDVHIEDLKLGYQSGAPSMFGHLLSTKLQETINRGDQAILFLNRRAYSPFLICRDCAHKWECSSCAVTLSYHRQRGVLKCHHCGFQQPAPTECPNCKGTKIKPFGIGTEKVEEVVTESFPGARVTRLDRDIAQKAGALEQVIASFRSGEFNVLIGTQMVAKGLDFPNVTLVGVIAADLSLNLPDFRASERTFQLLGQVAGRSGRGAKRGEVVIQTFEPTVNAIVCAQTHDYLAFYQSVIRERELAAYPPFRRLVNIIFSGDSRPNVVGASAVAHERLKRIEGFEVKDAVDCPLERLQTKWRRHILVKAPAGASVSSIGASLADLDAKGVTIVIDVDPLSMM